MRRRLSALGVATAALVAVTVNAGQAGAANNGSTPLGPADSGSAISAPAPAGVPGVTAGSDGWLNYTNTISSRLHLADARTRTVAGKRAAYGSCEVSGSSVAKRGTATTFEEEVALNPATCAQKIVTGTIDQADAAALNALGANGATPASSAGTVAPGADRAPAADRPSAGAARSGGVVSSAATSFGYAYTKTAWIDPLNIVITSLTPNIKYPLRGSGASVYYWSVPYAFSWDGWSSSGVNNRFSYLYPSGTYGWQVEAVDHFTNKDFATFIYVTMGLAGWLACGARFTVTAHFNHDVIVQGFANGNRGAGWNDSADGACANLVHHASWSGWGTAS